MFTFRTSTNVYLLNLAIADIVTLVFGGLNDDADVEDDVDNDDECCRSRHFPLVFVGLDNASLITCIMLQTNQITSRCSLIYKKDG